MDNQSSTLWGVCCEGGKKYSQVVTKKFHVTMAALDPTVTPTSPVVSVMVNHEGSEFLLCSLKPGTLLQANLNLYFDKNERITFFLVGQGKVHLTGYHIVDKNDLVRAAKKEKIEISSQLNTVSACPSKTSEENSLTVANKLDNSSDVPEIIAEEDNKIGQSASPKKELESKQKKMATSNNDESEEDSDDEDLFAELEDDDSSEEDSGIKSKGDKKDANRLQSYKRLWSSLTQSEEEDGDEESDNGDSDESSEENSKKGGKEFQNTKRPKTISNEESRKGTPGVSVVVNEVKLVKKTPKQDVLNSSIGRTPMPMKKTPKEILTNSTKTVTPKKVNFVDVESSDSDNEKGNSSMNATPNKATEPVTPNSESKKKRKKKKKNQATPSITTTNETPTKTQGLSSASYNQKLPGGLQYEDIRVGNGPIAKKGRLVHVYYTGMLENNKVFDSREIGNKPFSFKLGGNQVIKGWDMAVEGMKVGGKRRMKIPPSLGYANARTGPIPPNSTLYFTVELKAVS